MNMMIKINIIELISVIKKNIIKKIEIKIKREKLINIMIIKNIIEMISVIVKNIIQKKIKIRF